jgi:hypothetical protein
LITLLDTGLAFANLALLMLAAVALFQTGRISRYPLPFLFFALSSALGILLCAQMMYPFLSRLAYIQLYWANDLIEQGFALALMVFVLRLALAGERSSAIIGQGLASLAVVLVAILLTENQKTFSGWMTGFTRNLSFGVALMNFQVWGVLVARRVRSREILLLASGLGLLTTGKSLGHTIRIVATKGGWAEPIGNYIVIATAIAAAYTWWIAFRPNKNRPQLVKAA